MLFLIVFGIVSPCSFCQEKEENDGGGSIEIESDRDAADLSESINELLEHPVSVVHPSYGDLVRIPGLSGRLAESIIRFTDTVTVEECDQLRSVDGMSEEQFAAIRPYISVPSAGSAIWNVKDLRIRSKYVQRMMRTDGFRSGVYEGGIPAIDHRWTIRTEALSLGAHLSKDAGERLKDGTTSYYLQWSSNGMFHRFLFGDFSLGFGEGLLLSRSMTSAKGTDVTGQVERTSTAFSPRLPSEEGMAMHGAAASIVLSDVNVTMFRSSAARTASLDPFNRIRSVDLDGLFRSPAERSRRGNIRETSAGIIAEVPVWTDLQFSAAWLSHHWDHPLAPEASPSIGRNTTDAFSAAFRWQSSHLRSFGEAASSHGRRWNAAGGLIVEFDRNWSFAFHLRSFDAGALGPYSHPFMEGSSMEQKERGIYSGLEYREGKIRCGAFIDQSVNDAAANAFSANGLDRMVFVEIHPSRGTQISLRYRHRLQESGETDPLAARSIQQRLRAEIALPVLRRVRISYRAEWSIIEPSWNRNETGFLTFVDVAGTGSVFSLRSRLTFFDTPSYDARIYASEPDLPGMISAPAFYNSGMRWTLLLTAELGTMLHGSIRYGRTWYPGVVSIGSGADRIEGNRDDRLGLQLDFRI